MALLIVILVGFGFYLVTKSQGLEIQIKKLERHVSDLEEQLRRLHAKIVNQMPEPKPAPSAAIPAAAAPSAAVST